MHPALASAIQIFVMIRFFPVVPLLAAALCSPFIQTPLKAQNGNGMAKVQALAAQLSLTPEQKRQLIPILVAEAPKVQAIRTDSSLTKLQKLQQLKAVHDQTDPQVKAILTPAQYQKLQEIRRQEVEQAVKKRMGQ